MLSIPIDGQAEIRMGGGKRHEDRTRRE